MSYLKGFSGKKPHWYLVFPWIQSIANSESTEIYFQCSRRMVIAMRNFKQLSPSLELCLCSHCASIYYEDHGCHIERADLGQVVFEPCDICKNPHGYDFLIWDVSSVQNRNSHVCGGRRK